MTLPQRGIRLPSLVFECNVAFDQQVYHSMLYQRRLARYLATAWLPEAALVSKTLEKIGVAMRRTRREKIVAMCYLHF